MKRLVFLLAISGVVSHVFAYEQESGKELRFFEDFHNDAGIMSMHVEINGYIQPLFAKCESENIVSDRLCKVMVPYALETSIIEINARTMASPTGGQTCSLRTTYGQLENKSINISSDGYGPCHIQLNKKASR